MESLAEEIAPFGIRTMLVEPGFFRTELLTDQSTVWPDASIDDYAAKTRETVAGWKKMNGLQGGDPAKLAPLTVGPDSPGQCEPGLSDDRPRDPRLCYCPALSPRATRSSSS